MPKHVDWKKRNVRRTRLSNTERDVLHDYVKQYKNRGVIGVWAELADAIEVALNEITKHRTKKAT